MENRKTATKDKDVFYALVAPAVAGDGVDYFECEAIYCCDDTDRNPVDYWDTMTSYEYSYMPGSKGFPSAQSFDRLTSDRLAKVKLRGRLISVDIEKRKIVKITKTVEVKYDYEDMPVPASA